MRRVAAALVAGILFTSGSIAEAAVSVTSADPSRFTDADRAGGLMTPTATADSLARFLEGLARRLPPDTDLAIRIDDVDLAGRLAPEFALATRTRILDGATWPRIRLSYRLTRAGRVLASGQDLVDRKDYLSRPTGRYAGDPLRYEKTMLEEWFAGRFARR